MTTQTHTIVACRVTDWSRLAKLFRQTFPEVPESEISYQLRNYRDDIRLIQVNGVLAGFTVLIRDKAPGLAWLEQIAVEPSMRGCGLARALLEDFEERAAASGLTRVEFSVRESNDDAIRLYQSSGYQRTGSAAGKLIYRKDLSPVAREPELARPRSRGVLAQAWWLALYKLLVRSRT